MYLQGFNADSDSPEQNVHPFSLIIPTVLSEPSQSANRIIVYHRMYEWMILYAYAGSESANFGHVRRHFFA